MKNESSLRILVADDDSAIRRSLRGYLEDAGYAVVEAVDGGQANDICRQGSINLVLLDLRMPGVDGVSRWPATEVMIATDAVRSLIRKGDDHQLRSQIGTGRADGMMTMEQSLAELVRAGRITRETAYAHGHRTDDLQRYLG